MISVYGRRLIATRPLHVHGVRWISTSRDLMVTQERGSQDCTRASIATIINTLRRQPLASIRSVDEQLAELCFAYRRRNIDGLQPALEERAASEIFQRYGLRAIRASYSAFHLSNVATARILRPTFESGMYLSTSQPPSNSPNVSHSLVTTGLSIDPNTNLLRYSLFDPYPVPQRNLDGMYDLDTSAIIHQNIRTNLFVCRL